MRQLYYLFIGFIIIGVGVIGIILGFFRLLMLTLVSVKVRSQLKSDRASNNNPLGRVLMVAESNPNADTETLELKLGEAIYKAEQEKSGEAEPEGDDEPRGVDDDIVDADFEDLDDDKRAS